MQTTTFLTFVGDQCGNAEEAIAFYTSIFPNSEIKSITKSDSKISYIEAPKKRYDYEVERRVGSSEKLEELTSYKPETGLSEGLNKIFNRNY